MSAAGLWVLAAIVAYVTVVSLAVLLRRPVMRAVRKLRPVPGLPRDGRHLTVHELRQFSQIKTGWKLTAREPGRQQ